MIDIQRECIYSVFCAYITSLFLRMVCVQYSVIWLAVERAKEMAVLLHYKNAEPMVTKH